jgi:hypothetical protein
MFENVQKTTTTGPAPARAAAVEEVFPEDRS